MKRLILFAFMLLPAVWMEAQSSQQANVQSAAQFAYDANGNLTKDLTKGISEIQYNFLNLPSKVIFENGDSITYVYAADGRKLQTVRSIGGQVTTTDYCGNVIYENGVQKLLLTEEGYVTLADKKYHYYLKDHQGNNRVVVDQNGKVEEVNHYYPFGGLFANTDGVQPYKYNGKELDSTNGMNLYDYGARMYDPALGRFTTMDPMAEKYYSVSPYAYCGNNPVRFIDSNGMEFGPGDLFRTKREAALDWGMYYNGYSITKKREMGSSIYEVNENGKTKGYSYSQAEIGTAHRARISTSPHGEKIVGTIHSHGNYDGFIIDKKGEKRAVNDNNFSTKDKEHNKRLNLVGYLVTPNGSLFEHDPSTGKVSTISEQLPSDPKDPTRKNEIMPIDNSVKEQIPILSKIADWLTSLFRK